MAKHRKKNRTGSLKPAPSQIRMACVGLGWNWEELAEAAEVSRDTIARLLRGEEVKASTADAIAAALEKAGVEFIPENGGGAGVRLAKRKGKR